MPSTKYQNLAATVKDVCTIQSGRTCLRFPEGTSWSYGELEVQINQAAVRLQQHGLGPGDRVLVQSEKSAYAVATYFAVLHVGAVYVPINTANTVAELKYYISDAEPALTIVPSADIAERLAPQSAIAFSNIDGVPWYQFEEDGERTSAEVAPRTSDDLAAILYTSGTTGKPKGAMLSHGNLLSNAKALINVWGWQSDDVLLHALPIYHVHGLFVAIHCALLTGTSMLFHEKFDADQVLRSLPDATVMMGVPTFYSRLLASKELDASLVSHMRLFISGSAPLTEQIFNQFESRTGMRILERYGMTETGMITSNPLNEERVAGTVGFDLPGVSTRIVDELGAELDGGEVGAIQVRGPNVFNGYWRNPERTASEFTDDGWFKTGDMGTKDSAGRLSIVGRAKDLVISGGLNVYPAEVETLLDQIDGVNESAIFGVPHDDFGEAVVAALATSRTVELAEVKAYLRDHCAGYKHPKHIVLIDELPKNAMGKVQKNVLRDQYANLFS